MRTSWFFSCEKQRILLQLILILLSIISFHSLSPLKIGFYIWMQSFILSVFQKLESLNKALFSPLQSRPLICWNPSKWNLEIPPVNSVVLRIIMGSVQQSFKDAVIIPLIKKPIWIQVTMTWLSSRLFLSTVLKKIVAKLLNNNLNNHNHRQHIKLIVPDNQAAPGAMGVDAFNIAWVCCV